MVHALNAGCTWSDLPMSTAVVPPAHLFVTPGCGPPPARAPALCRATSPTSAAPFTATKRRGLGHVGASLATSSAGFVQAAHSAPGCGKCSPQAPAADLKSGTPGCVQAPASQKDVVLFLPHAVGLRIIGRLLHTNTPCLLDALFGRAHHRCFHVPA